MSDETVDAAIDGLSDEWDARAEALMALTLRVAGIVSSDEPDHPDPSPDDERSRVSTEEIAQLLETLIAFAGDMLLVVSVDSVIRFASPSVRRYMGHDPRDLVGQSAFDFISDEDLQPVLELFDEAMSQELPAAVYQTSVTTASGDRRWVEAITVDLVEDPAIGGFITTLRDVTDRVEAEQAAINERQRFEDLIDSLPDVIVRLDTELRPVYGNAAAHDADGSWLVAGEGSPGVFASETEAMAHATQELQLVLATGEPRTFESTLTTRRGSVWLSSIAIPERDTSGAITGILVVTRDVTVYRARTEELTRRALEDPLTGLANRSRLEAELERALFSSAETGSPVGVLFADLDGFKEINDQHGHAIGDKLLQTFARRAREALRPSDLIARFGGDEFVVLPNRLHIPAELESLAERLHGTVRNPFEIEGRSLTVSLSIGIASASAKSALSTADLLRRADQAMYASKRNGRDRTTTWSLAVAGASRTEAT